MRPTQIILATKYESGALQSTSFKECRNTKTHLFRCIHDLFSVSYVSDSGDNYRIQCGKLCIALRLHQEQNDMVCVDVRYI